MTLSTASQLFAKARGIDPGIGEHRCFYCLAPCNDKHKSSDYVKRSFTGRDTVGGGDYVCAGCVEATNEKADIELIDGEKRTGQKIRSYSWVITEDKAIAATKSHRSEILSVLLDPPKPPYSIVISDSGQKHLIYRGKVCHSQSVITATLEGEPITFRPKVLSANLKLCKQVASAIGKPALSEEPTISQLVKITDHHQDETLAYIWPLIRTQRITRLSIWLTPSKKECELEFPAKTL